MAAGSRDSDRLRRVVSTQRMGSNEVMSGSVNEHLEQMDDWMAACEEAARAGGEQLRAFRGAFATRFKGPADLVTDADLASQEAIRNVIARRFPDHAFLGEERHVDDVADGSSRFIWVVDPLDGTTNYVHDYPQYSVSVGLAEGNQLLVGVVYDPVHDLCFSAGLGRGASCNGSPMRTSRVTSVEHALVAVSLPTSVARDAPDLLDFIEATQATQAIRRAGSAALNFAYVAKGALDAFWATHIHPWDVAAGVLLVREAGGVITSRRGDAFDLWNPHFVASANAELHAGMLEMLRPYAGR